MTSLDDMVIRHFDNKAKAFSYFRRSGLDTLVAERFLIDTSKGIIAGGNQGEEQLRKQYDLFRERIKTKYPAGTRVKILQLCNTGRSALFDRSSCIGKTGKAAADDFFSMVTLDLGEEETCPIEVGKDQIKIV